MLLRLDVRDLVLASWAVDEESIVRVVPPAFAPAPLGERHAVTVASFRVTGGRLGRVPVVPFAQLNVRVYTELRGEPAVFFALARVTLPGLPGALIGAPYRPARIRVRPGKVSAPGLGLELAYAVGDPDDPGVLGRHELGLFEAGGELRAFRITRAPATWRRGEPAAAKTELLTALGFEPSGMPDVLYAGRARFSATVPPERAAP